MDNQRLGTTWRVWEYGMKVAEFKTELALLDALSKMTDSGKRLTSLNIEEVRTYPVGRRRDDEQREEVSEYHYVPRFEVLSLFT